jgi:hypothetical protein
MTEIGAIQALFDLGEEDWRGILASLPGEARDTSYTEFEAGTGPLPSSVMQWLIELWARQLAFEERMAMLEHQTHSTDTGVVLSGAIPVVQTTFTMSMATSSPQTGAVLSLPIPVVQTTRERLWAMGQEGRSRALEYDGDPIEDLHRVLPEGLSAEEWRSIISGAYD